MFGILLLILVNLAIGYALALYFHRPELYSIAWRFMPTALPPVMLPARRATADSLPATLPVVARPVRQDVSDTLSSDANSDRLEPAPGLQINPDSAQAMDVIREELKLYCAALSRLESEVTQHTDERNSGYVLSYVEKFDRLSDGYLAQQAEHLSSIDANASESVNILAEPCKTAVDQHNAAIATTRENLAAAAALAGPAAACRAFLEATGCLAEANLKMQRQLDRTLKDVSRRLATSSPAQDSSPNDADGRTSSNKPLRDDPVNLEKAVAEFIGIQRNLAEEFTVSLVEVDQLADIKRQHGSGVAKRILDAISNCFATFGPQNTMSIDEEREQFLYFRGDATSRETTNSVEQLRQRIYAATFQHGDLDLKVTLSCGVAEAKCSESPEQIVRRLQEILGEARRYGRNRTFFQEGEQWSPAIPPTVQVDARVIEV